MMQNNKFSITDTIKQKGYRVFKKTNNETNKVNNGGNISSFFGVKSANFKTRTEFQRLT